jgi:SAM-dependent methyltransferase
MNRFSRWLVNRSNASRSVRLLDTVAPALDLPASPRILELGSGAGHLGALVFERLHPGRLVVTDYDPVQVEATRRSVAARFGGVPPGVEVRQADALHLPFEDGAFDCLIAAGVFHHVEASHTDFRLRPAAVREARRVLAPGGTLVYTEFTRRKEFRDCLGENGFTPTLLKVGWTRDLGVFRAPRAA